LIVNSYFGYLVRLVPMGASALYGHIRSESAHRIIAPSADDPEHTD